MGFKLPVVEAETVASLRRDMEKQGPEYFSPLAQQVREENPAVFEYVSAMTNNSADPAMCLQTGLTVYAMLRVQGEKNRREIQ
jgi:hypothetical protein